MFPQTADLDWRRRTGDSIMVIGEILTSKASRVPGGANLPAWPDTLGSRVMTLRLMEAGEEVSPEEIFFAMGDLKKAMRAEARAGGTGTARFGRSGRFRIWQDLSGSGVIDADTAAGIRVSLTLQSVEDNVIIQSTIADSDGYWELHDTPTGGAARTQIKPGEGSGGAYIWRVSHYSYGRRWDPTPDQAAENFYYENGKIRCRQRFVQGAAKGTDDCPVFEAFRQDGSRLITEYGSSINGKHRSMEAGPAYQEFHPCGAVALVVFSTFGTQQGPAVLFSPGGTAIEERESSPVPCGALTNAESWVARNSFTERAIGAENESITGPDPKKTLKPLGIALSEALSQRKNGSPQRSRGGKTR